MANPIDALKKIKGRSWTEIRARGEQAISACGEQIGFGGGALSDADFARLLDAAQFGGGDISAEFLLEKFYENSETAFFQSFRQPEKTLEIFRRDFGERSARYFIEKAERILEGRFDLLGYENLDFGAPVDWHLEPLSGKISPKKHWKQFDDMTTNETGDVKIVWELNRQQHFFTLGVAYQLTKDERFAAAFAEHIESWTAQNQPGVGINWASSLEVAFRAVSWLWAFHLFRGSPGLTPEIFRDALKSLFSHGRHIAKYLSTYYSPNTHLTGEALGLYYLGTQLPFFERAAHWRKIGADILFKELDRQLLPDGVYFEQSTWYQRYTTDFYTQFQILERLNGGESGGGILRAKLDEKLASSLDYLMSITRPDGTTAFIGDDDGGRSLPHTSAAANDFRAVLSTGAVLFERGDYKFVAGEFAAETLWLLGADAADAFEKLPAREPAQASRAFGDGGYFVMRDGWTETDNYMLVDCGEIGSLAAGHGHADALAIDAAIGGKTVFVDAGTCTYHESEAARNHFRATAAHNTLTVDGKSQSEPGAKFSWRTKARARLDKWISDNRFDFFRSAHDGYERLESAATHERAVLFLKNDYWIMRDFVKTGGEHDYALNFQFAAETNPSIERTKSGSVCVEEKSGAGGVGSRLFAFGDGGEWRRRTSRVSPIFGKSVDAPHLSFALSGAGAQEIFTFLVPFENGFAAPDVFETPLAGGRAFVVEYRGGTDNFVFSDGAQTIENGIFKTDFEFFWARSSGGEPPEEFVLVGGSRFSVGGVKIIESPHALNYAVARRLGDRLNVRTPEGVFSAALEPEK